MALNLPAAHAQLAQVGSISLLLYHLAGELLVNLLL